MLAMEVVVGGGEDEGEMVGMEVLGRGEEEGRGVEEVRMLYTDVVIGGGGEEEGRMLAMEVVG